MWKYNETSNLPGNSLYHSADELYHYGVLGMKWKNHVYKTYDAAPRTNKISKPNNEKKKWSTKKKIAVGAAAVAAIGAGVYLSKKYVDKTNKKIARIYADRIFDRSIKNYMNSIDMPFPLKRYSPDNKHFSKNVIKTMDAANNNWNKAYDKINKANFTDKVKNIYNYKKHGNIRDDKLSVNELRKLGIKTFNYRTR